MWDKHGKHTGYHQKVDNVVCDLIQEHMHSFPARSSHYSHSDNSGRVYLSPDLSIAWLYTDFLKEHDPQFMKLQEENCENCERVISHQQVQQLHKPIATHHFYHDLFVKEFIPDRMPVTPVILLQQKWRMTVQVQQK